ncbi:Red protein [Operophtera brumata]|uniref:Red protein n=1 Tax=Operophtera brumata TaxID=104452 RepID=A0A0L7L113_OPEBR|nr:Red protein [Operophtera brumata]
MLPPTENKSELRRKKKSYYAALKKQEDTKLAELAEKYRDRARERRDGTNELGPTDPTSNTSSAYRYESKYLGGDMEHTHLVKGLDYALLQKEQEEEMERLVTAPVEEATEKKEVVQETEEMQFKTPVGKNIYNLVIEQKNKKVSRNELFAPGRMAYVVELEEEGSVDSDIPTTLTRSKADVPAADEASSAAAATGADKATEKGRNEDSIYGEIGEYNAGEKRADRRDERPHTGYFDKPLEVDKEEAAEPEGYAECYPGLREMDDAIDDSDDEVDYTKMDAGNKKGPIGRWDFDTQEEYSAYMGSKEALPKAAFQYGIQNIIQKRKAPANSEEPGYKSAKF